MWASRPTKGDAEQWRAEVVAPYKGAEEAAAAGRPGVVQTSFSCSFGAIHLLRPLRWVRRNTSQCRDVVIAAHGEVCGA
jgi:hypothetical protein